MSTEYITPDKHTLKILCKSKHFPQRYKRKCEWVFFFWTQCSIRKRLRYDSIFDNCFTVTLMLSVLSVEDLRKLVSIWLELWNFVTFLKPRVNTDSSLVNSGYIDHKAGAYTMMGTAMKTWKTNSVLVRNRQILGEFTFIPSSENMFVAVAVVAIMVIVCGRHGLWPALSNPDYSL